MAMTRDPRDLAAPPAEVLAPAELQACWDWRQRWGTVVKTREPEEGKTLMRFCPARIPLVEVVNRRAYDRLHFARWLIRDGQLGKEDWL